MRLSVNAKVNDIAALAIDQREAIARRLDQEKATVARLRALLSEALDELEEHNPAGVSLQDKIRREIGGEKP